MKRIAHLAAATLLLIVHPSCSAKKESIEQSKKKILSDFTTIKDIINPLYESMHGKSSLQDPFTLLGIDRSTGKKTGAGIPLSAFALSGGKKLQFHNLLHGVEEFIDQAYKQISFFSGKVPKKEYLVNSYKELRYTNAQDYIETLDAIATGTLAFYKAPDPTTHKPIANDAIDRLLDLHGKLMDKQNSFDDFAKTYKEKNIRAIYELLAWVSGQIRAAVWETYFALAQKAMYEQKQQFLFDKTGTGKVVTIFVDVKGKVATEATPKEPLAQQVIEGAKHLKPAPKTNIQVEPVKEIPLKDLVPLRQSFGLGKFKEVKKFVDKYGKQSVIKAIGKIDQDRILTEDEFNQRLEDMERE